MSHPGKKEIVMPTLETFLFVMAQPWKIKSLSCLAPAPEGEMSARQ